MGNKSKGSAAMPKKRKEFAGKKHEEVVMRSDMETTAGEDGNVPSTSSTNADILNVSVVDDPVVTVLTIKRKLDRFVEV